MNTVLLKAIRAYQIIVSPILGQHCRFYPSCSEYAYQSLQKYGPFQGSFLAIKRITRCQPFSKGGVDTP